MPEEVLGCYPPLTIAEWNVLAYVMKQIRFGEEVEPMTETEMFNSLGISRNAIARARESLTERGWIIAKNVSEDKSRPRWLYSPNLHKKARSPRQRGPLHDGEVLSTVDKKPLHDGEVLSTVDTLNKEEERSKERLIENPQEQNQNGGPAALELSAQDAARGLCELLGVTGWQNRNTAKESCETIKRRKPELRFEQIPEFIAGLWREYDTQATHGKVSLKTFLGEIGRFVDSDSWRKKGKEPQRDAQGGYFEGNVYVNAEGKRLPGYRPPPPELPKPERKRL